MLEWIILLCVAGIGASLGSFLNVCYYRIPKGISVNNPKCSQCPQCNKKIPLWRNIPLVSWLIQLGRCACGDFKIPFHYLGFEIVGALLGALLGWYLVS